MRRPSSINQSQVSHPEMGNGCMQLSPANSPCPPTPLAPKIHVAPQHLYASWAWVRRWWACAEKTSHKQRHTITVQYNIILKTIQYSHTLDEYFSLITVMSLGQETKFHHCNRYEGTRMPPCDQHWSCCWPTGLLQCTAHHLPCSILVVTGRVTWSLSMTELCSDFWLLTSESMLVESLSRELTTQEIILINCKLFELCIWPSHSENCPKQRRHHWCPVESPLAVYPWLGGS